MIYPAPCIMFWMRAYPLHGQVGGGWALKFESFLGPVNSRAHPPPTCPSNGYACIQTLCTGLYKSYVHRWFYAQEPTREVSGPTEGGGGAGA